MLDFGANIPFVHELGFSLRHMQGGTSELHYEARPEHLNSYGVTHGGATMTLLDVALATAARSDTPDQGVVTVEMKASFMHPARGPLVAKGRRLHRTRSLAFAEGAIYDAEGRMCSHATGTFKYVPKAAREGASVPTD
ncbi:PaaI family thioesterase [Acidovorax sp. SDU_ACID1]|uniref:PaaI family thioesterase n=1 Tax=Acidovorax sp. SDU_ACID1 TaxID=3136632 RepID=UPI003873A34C